LHLGKLPAGERLPLNLKIDKGWNLKELTLVCIMKYLDKVTMNSIIRLKDHCTDKH
jgi:hypothetical protein